MIKHSVVLSISPCHQYTDCIVGKMLAQAINLSANKVRTKVWAVA